MPTAAVLWGTRPRRSTIEPSRRSRELWPCFDLRSLYRLSWGAANTKGKRIRARSSRKSSSRACDAIKTKRWRGDVLQPRVVYGYFPAAGLGDDVILYDPSRSAAARSRGCRFRAKSAANICVSPITCASRRKAGASDVVALQIVTIGSSATRRTEALQAAGDYSESYFLHGFSVQAAEALAEHTHRRIRRSFVSRPARQTLLVGLRRVSRPRAARDRLSACSTRQPHRRHADRSLPNGARAIDGGDRHASSERRILQRRRDSRARRFVGASRVIPALLAVAFAHLWTHAESGWMLGTPTIATASSMRARHAASVLALDERDGHVLWRDSLGANPDETYGNPRGVISSVAVVDNVAYAMSGSCEAAAFDALRGIVIWERVSVRRRETTTHTHRRSSPTGACSSASTSSPTGPRMPDAKSRWMRQRAAGMVVFAAPLSRNRRRYLVHARRRFARGLADRWYRESDADALAPAGRRPLHRFGDRVRSTVGRWRWATAASSARCKRFRRLRITELFQLDVDGSRISAVGGT